MPVCALFAATAVLADAGLLASIATVRSPDGSNAIILSLGADGAPTYCVTHRGRTVLGESPLGLRCSEEDFSRGLTPEAVGPVEARREAYPLLTGPQANVDQPHRRRTVVLRNAAGARLAIDLDAGNEGVAFRYRFPDDGGSRTVTAELTGFAVGEGAEAWLQPYSPSTTVSPAYEEYYHATCPGDPPPPARHGPGRGWYLPALLRVPSARAWLLIAESGAPGDFCGCHLSADSTSGLYRIEFPFPDEGTPGYQHPAAAGSMHALPWTMPWRVVVLGDAPGELLTSTLITDLAPPGALTDISWIRPGRASWSWWSHPEGPPTVELYARYLDLAGRFGWEHSLLDAGWWQTDVARVSALAGERDLSLFLWTAAYEFYDPARRRAKLDELAAAGAQGVKVDFWCSDRQDTLAAIGGTLEDAAKRRLMVNLHGCTVPRGWQRTYPNLLTAEAVLGAESYMFDAQFPARAAEYNTLVPFSRNVTGPVDYTPLGLTLKQHGRLTTAAHELALAVILTSGLVHYADTPEAYDGLPEAAQAVLRDAPARWDETRCLVGEPGRCVVVARRAGESWFIAGLNGTAEPLRLRLPLRAFGRYPSRVLIAEGPDPRMQVGAAPVAPRTVWEHTIPPRGGFILRAAEPAR
jgi:hypothetical protein